MIDIFSITPLILMLAFLLDLAIGDPRWLPHPVRIIGRAIIRTEALLRKSGVKSQESRVKLKGILLVIIIVGLAFGASWFIVYILSLLITHYSLLVTIMLVYLTSTTIAVRELIISARHVIAALKQNDIKAARQYLGMIVGRDTHDLSEKDISKATIETVSENLSDGVIAPIFYLLIGGLPLAMAYKAVNTLDSMVGYKNDRYKDFGWAAARIDDIANYIPARISGALIAISVFFFTIFKCPSSALRITHYALRIMIRDGKKHPSPNAGIPEAAIAGALGVRLGGPSTYRGIVAEKPYIGQYIGNDEKKDYLYASEKAVGIIKVASALGVGAGLGILYLFEK